jgi:hypothetical protein
LKKEDGNEEQKRKSANNRDVDKKIVVSGAAVTYPWLKAACWKNMRRETFEVMSKVRVRLLRFEPCRLDQITCTLTFVAKLKNVMWKASSIVT